MPESLVVSPGVVVRESTYAPRSRIARHAHAWAFVSLVVRGRVEETCAGGGEVRGAGAVRIMPAGEPHANAYDDGGARSLVIEIAAEAASALTERGATLDVLASHRAGSVVSGIARRVHHEYRQRDALTPLAVDGLLYELLAAAARDGDRRDGGVRHVPAWLARVRDRLHDELRAAPTLRALAAGAGVHPSHLVRCYRRAYGRAPAEHLAHIRIERACRLLTDTAETISRIAADVGFSDQAHFTRRFRVLVGTTPGRYRARMRGEE